MSIIWNINLTDLPDLLPPQAFGTVRGIIAFPAAYAQYHDKTASPNQPRDVFAESFRRRHREITRNFEAVYRRSQHLERSVEAVTREHLNEMKAFELNAPGAGPPSANPFTNRLRRITGQLADTAFVRVERLQ